MTGRVASSSSGTKRAGIGRPDENADPARSVERSPRALERIITISIDVRGALQAGRLPQCRLEDRLELLVGELDRVEAHAAAARGGHDRRDVVVGHAQRGERFYAEVLSKIRQLPERNVKRRRLQ